jgi:hypothetical protein
MFVIAREYDPQIEMKRIALARLGLVFGLTVGIPACVYDGYGGAYYDDGYYEPGYVAGPSYVGSGYYYGDHYYRGHYRHDHYDHHDHDDDHHHRGSSRDDDNEKMKLVRYNEQDRRRNLPEGYHSAEWYKSRGYSLKQNTFRERDGDTRGRESSRSRNDNRSRNDDKRGDRGDRDKKR